MGVGGSGSGSSISAGQMGQLINSVNKANQSSMSADSEAELLGGGPRSGGPQMSEQYLNAMDQKDNRESWEKMIAALGSQGGGGSYMG